MTELELRIDIRELTRLWQKLCSCAGPQPSMSNSRTEDHQPDCLYAVKVESDSSFREATQRA